MTINYVTLVLDAYDGQGNVITKGSASFVPSVQLADAGAEWIPEAPIPCVFHAGGTPQVKLLATDSSGPLPAGWNWTVTFSGVPGSPASFSFFLPHAGGATQYLSDLVPVATSAPAAYSSLDWLNVVTQFGADPTGTNLCDTAFANAVAALPDPGGTPTPPQPLGGGIYVPAGTYLVSEALNWKVNGLRVMGDGWASAVIVQTTANTPVVQVAGYGQEISGMTFAYQTPQTSAQTSGICVTFGDDTVGSCFMSSFHDLFFQGGSTCMSINPAIAGSTAGLFSCHFDNIQCNLWSVSAISLVGNNGLGGANCTGCVFDNIYLGNNNTSDVAQSATSYAVLMRFWDEFVFNQLNVEHVVQASGQHVIACISVRNAVFGAVHCEGVVCSTNGKGILYCSGTGSEVVNGLRLLTCTFSGSASNAAVTFFGSGPSTVAVHGYSEQSCTVTTPSHPLIDFNSATNCTAVIDGVGLNQTTANAVNSASGDFFQVGSVTIDAVAADIQPLGTRAAGSAGHPADGSHVHSNTLSNGVNPATSGFTAFGTGGVANLINSSSGADITMVAGTWYYSALYIPFNVTLTGFQLPAGTVGGTDSWIVALWGVAGGAALATSALAGTAAPSAGVKKAFPFTAPLAVTGPGVYVFGLQSNGTAARFRAFSNAVEGFVTGSVTGVFGTVPSLSPATTYTVNLGPFASSY